MPSPQLAVDGFEEIEHAADWSLRLRGRDLRELLTNAARGMSSLLVPDLDAVPLAVTKQFAVEGIDGESLLVNWLSELAYWAEMEQIVFTRFGLTTVTSTHLRATAQGGPVPDLQKHIKAVTYHNLEIIETDAGLETTIVFDV